MTKESFWNSLRDAVKTAVVTKSAHGLHKVTATAGFARRLDRRLAGGGEADARNGKPRTSWGTFPHPLNRTMA